MSQQKIHNKHDPFNPISLIHLSVMLIFVAMETTNSRPWCRKSSHALTFLPCSFTSTRKNNCFTASGRQPYWVTGFQFCRKYKTDKLSEVTWPELNCGLCTTTSRATASALLGPWTPDTSPKVTVVNDREREKKEWASLLNSFVWCTCFSCSQDLVFI